MAGNQAVAQDVKNRRRNIGLIFLLLAVFVIILVGLMIPFITTQIDSQISSGEVASREFVAPRSLTYSSDILTEAQREAASNSIPAIYSPPDTSIARKQLESLRGTIAFISSVRADSFASIEEKLADLAALEDIDLDQETALSILELSDSRWQAVQQEAIVVLEQIMRATIRENQLEDARDNVPALVSLSLPEDQAAVVSELVNGFVASNSLYSEVLTETARQNARESVTPVERSFVQGQTLLLKGQIISETDLEALEQFDLVKSQTRWQDLLSAGALALLTLTYFLIYFSRNPSLTADLRGLTVIFILFTVFLIGGRFIVNNQSVIPYIYPIAAFSLVVASLFGTQTALVFTLPLTILFTYDTPNAFELTLYNLVGSYTGVFALGAARRITSFFWAAALIAFSEVMVIIAFRVAQPNVDYLSIAALIGIALVNGIASSSLAVLLQYILAQILGMTTALQLMEISRPDHPLLQFILRNAPGTYQHSLQVANLAEQAAENIGADTLLTRVGAIYHDAGKALNPYFFIENQLPGNTNPHDNLSPISSSHTIISHVPDGIELARKYRLPRRIQDFIGEHHGTMITRYQYAKAVEAAGGDEGLVDKNQFGYPGPRPRSRETAILMLADGSEARVRAEHPPDENALRKVIKSVIEQRLSSGQLDETDLTLRDLDQLIDSFTTTLRGIYHPRLEYPDAKKEIPPRAEEVPTVPIISRKSSKIPANPPADS
ncbi:MAG: HDIG domain-containing metalloprotein [Anaerolineales bacterium]|nr:HDIG domain-containing protein [Anaerolineales bacterium]